MPCPRLHRDCITLPLGRSITHPSETLPLTLTALIRVSLHYCTMSQGDYTFMNGVRTPWATCIPDGRKCCTSCRMHKSLTHSIAWMSSASTTYLAFPVQLFLQPQIFISKSQCSLCALQDQWDTIETCCVPCLFSTRRDAFHHCDKLTLPRSLLAHLTVMLSLKPNVSEQCTTVQHSRLTVTWTSFMESLCANLFSFRSGL
jgi:hypothetical protein